MPEIVQHLQNQLRALYALSSDHDIRQFMIDRPTFEEFTCEDDLAETEEQLLLRHHEDESLGVALYVQESVLENLRLNCPEKVLNESNHADFCILVEGISHFLLVDFRAHLEWPVSALEMELQAEIDKFVASFLYRYHHEGSTHFLDALHQVHFEQFVIKANLSDHERERYLFASQAAAKFCRHLQNRFLAGKPDWAGLLNLLRRFYRQGWDSKYATIRASKI